MRRRTALVAATCALGAVAVAAGWADLRHDDAYITFRYARHLVAGEGFVFNPGQRVLGTTSPLFTLVSAALYSLVGEALPVAAVAWNAAALAAQGFLLFLLLRDVRPWTAMLLAVLTVGGLGGAFSWLSLETHTAAALAVGALLAAGRDRPLAAGLLTGLAFLARPDAFLLVPVLLFGYRRRTGAALRLLLAAAATVLPWLVFATLYFGSPLPATMDAKRGITGAVDYLLISLAEAARLPFLPRDLPWPLITLVLAAIGIAYAVVRLPPLRPLLAYGAALVAAYTLLGPPVAQHWHLYLPFLLLRALAVLAPVAWLEERATRPLAVGAPRSGPGAAVALLSGVLVAATLAAAWGQARALPDDFWLQLRHRRYEEVARWLTRNAGTPCSFMAPEVGTLGYLTGCSMVDPYGLVTPTNDLPRTRAWVDFVALVRHYQPELLLVDSLEAARGLERISPYRVARVFPWDAPANVLLVLHPRVLREAARLPEPRGRAPAAAPHARGGGGTGSGER